MSRKEANKKVIEESFDDRTPLQKFIYSTEFDAAMIIFILLNCVLIAYSNPRLVLSVVSSQSFPPLTDRFI